MRLLKLGVLVLLVGAFGAGPQLGCSARTDCKKLKGKMTGCSDALWSQLEPHAGGPRIKKHRQWANAQHFRYCSKVKGRYKQSEAINKCLDIKDCDKFAECFCKAVKKKNCGKGK